MTKRILTCCTDVDYYDMLGFELSHCSSIEYTAAPALKAWQETSSTR